MSNYEISKSSLLSLKAEILRKQEDLVKAKQENVEKIKTIKRKTPLELKNKGVEDRGLNDLDEEEQDLLKLSKSKLEAKAKLYEKLSGDSNQSEEITRKYLVRFDKKEKDGGRLLSDSESVPDVPVDSDIEETHFSDEYDEEVDPSEEWVEYTDCLGRSRKCLRKDLEYLKSKDAQLISEKSATNSQKIVEVINEEKKETTDQETQSQISTEESELISGDMRREMLRQQWEQEEEELRNKTDIHYQNVLFSEARQHGVGYYAFSKDEEERAKQQEALKKLREETEQQQKRAQDLKALREKQMAARMKAARNRRRARLGLPPEDDPTPPPEVKENSEEEKKKQEEQNKAEELDKLLVEARKRHVRPWDIGKEGVSEHYEMTQEEWNEKKREERHKEFAPPEAYSKRDFSSMQFLQRSFEEENKSLKFSTKKQRKNKNLRNLEKQSLYMDNSKKKNVSEFDVQNLPDDDRLLQDYKKYQDSSLAALRGLNPYKNNSYNPIELTTSEPEDSDALLRDYRLLQDYKKPQDSSLATLRGLNPYKNNSYNPIEPISKPEDSDVLLRDYRLLQDYNKPQDSSLAELRGLNSYKSNSYNPVEPTSEPEDNDALLKDYEMSKTNFIPMEPTPIINELEEVDFDDRLLRDYDKVMQDVASQEEEILLRQEVKGNSRKRGVEIAPPPTFEYYGPGEGKRPKTFSGQPNISESIEAGLRFLRKQADRKGRHCVDDL